MLELYEQDGVAVLCPRGEVNHQAMARLKNTVVRLGRQGSHRLVLDLSQVDHINYLALGVLVECLRRTRDAGGEIALAQVSPYLLNILRFVGIQDLFTIRATVEEAVAASRQDILPLPVSLPAVVRA